MKRNKNAETIVENLRRRKGYLKTAELVELLEIGRNTLCKWVREDKIKALRLTNGYKFDPHYVADWFAAREV